MTMTTVVLGLTSPSVLNEDRRFKRVWLEFFETFDSVRIVPPVDAQAFD